MNIKLFLLAVFFSIQAVKASDFMEKAMSVVADRSSSASSSSSSASSSSSDSSNSSSSSSSSSESDNESIQSDASSMSNDASSNSSSADDDSDASSESSSVGRKRRYRKKGFQLFGRIDESSLPSLKPAGCLSCPPKVIVEPDCKAREVAVALDRTCFTCIRYVCIKAQILARTDPIICPKIKVTCDCEGDQTCVIVQRTKYRCEEAICVPKLFEMDRIQDHNLIESF